MVQYGVYFLSFKFSVILSEPAGEENIGKIWNEKNMPYCTRITCDNLFIVNTKRLKHINQSRNIHFEKKKITSITHLHQANKFKSIPDKQMISLYHTYHFYFAFCISISYPTSNKHISSSKIYFVYFCFERNFFKLCNNSLIRTFFSNSRLPDP